MADIDAPSNHNQQNDKPKAELITVQVKSGGDGVEVYFKIKKTTHFRKVLFSYKMCIIFDCKLPTQSSFSSILHGRSLNPTWSESEKCKDRCDFFSMARPFNQHRRPTTSDSATMT